VERVLVLDREPQAGGIPRHCGHSPYGWREYRRLMTGPAYARYLAAEATRAGAIVRTGITVTALHPGGRLSITSDAGVEQLSARAILLAMGARETPRAARLIGGTKPDGVMNTGALQGMAYLDHLRPFRRPLIFGTELVAFSALLTCRHIGARPVGMVEPGPRTTARWPAALLPRLVGVPLCYNTDLVAIEGGSRVTGAVLRHAGRDRHIACDGVIITGGFRPESALLATGHLERDPGSGGPLIDGFGRCSDPAYFAAGNLLRTIETAGWCWAEGRATATSIARALSGTLPEAAPAITLSGDALKYVVPQKPTSGGAHDRLQLRVTRPARGRLRLMVNGAEIASRDLSALPERRITLPLPPPGAQADIRFEEY
jgi:NADPH-dependent 2,4-dienoyl-CoA reductase/sulfur reductase-like enzyme